MGADEGEGGGGGERDREETDLCGFIFMWQTLSN